MNVIINDVQKFDNVIVCQRIKNTRPFLAGRYKVGVFQNLQLVGNQRLLRPHHSNDVRNALLSIHDGIHDFEAGEITGNVQKVFHPIKDFVR